MIAGRAATALLAFQPGLKGEHIGAANFSNIHLVATLQKQLGTAAMGIPCGLRFVGKMLTCATQRLLPISCAFSL